MKKILFIIILPFLLLQSCTSDNNEDNSKANQEQNVLLKKSIFDDGSILNIEYQGNKLLRYTSSDGTYSEFIYTGEKITRENRFSASKKLVEYSEFVYLNNSLSEVKEYLGTTLYRKVTFVKNSDNTITRTHTVYSGGSPKNTIYKEYYLNNQKVKQEQFSSTGAIVNTSTYTYDDKNCPTKNILGYKYLNGWYNGNSEEHNILKITESKFTSQTYTYQYNSNGFPTIENSTSGGYTEKTQYFY